MKEQKDLTRVVLGYFWKQALIYRNYGMIIVGGVVVCVGLDLFRPFVMKYMFDALATQGPKQEMLATVIYFFVFWQIVGFLRFAVWRGLGFKNNFFQPRIISDLMGVCYKYMLKHSYQFFTDNFAGSLQARVRKFAYAFETVADQVCFDLGRSFLTLLMIVGGLLIFSSQLGLIILVWLVGFSIFTYKFTKFKLPYDIAQSEQDTKVTAHLSDTFANHANVSLFAAEKREEENFKQITDELFELRKKSWDYAQIAEAVTGLSMIILEISVMGCAVNMWLHDNISIGGIVFIQAYLGRVFENTWGMSKNIRRVYEHLANANEMCEILELPHGIQDIPNSPPLLVPQGKVNLSNVHFDYGKGNGIFSCLNLEIPAGHKFALVGPSGGGKSTIVKLLLRQLDVCNGEIRIDGQNIAHVNQQSLREMVTLVPQEPMMFHRSLLENIRYGKPGATDAEVIAASKAAHCHEFISNFEMGYDTMVGERGIKLSGGQRQRVAIARAFLRNSPILVLDEATSSLDSESEMYIQDSLKRLMEGKTTIVIAHRLSTIKAMDWIVVLDKGKIIEQGTHDSLLNLAGKYNHHWQIQSGGFANCLAA